MLFVRDYFVRMKERRETKSFPSTSKTDPDDKSKYI